MWAFSTVGQAVIPVPVAGALIGGMVGYAASVVVIEGMKLAAAAGLAAVLEEEKLRELERWIYDAIERLAESRLLVERVDELHQLHFVETRTPT